MLRQVGQDSNPGQLGEKDKTLPQYYATRSRQVKDVEILRKIEEQRCAGEEQEPGEQGRQELCLGLALGHLDRVCSAAGDSPKEIGSTVSFSQSQTSTFLGEWLINESLDWFIHLTSLEREWGRLPLKCFFSFKLWKEEGGCAVEVSKSGCHRYGGTSGGIRTRDAGVQLHSGKPHLLGRWRLRRRLGRPGNVAASRKRRRLSGASSNRLFWRLRFKSRPSLQHHFELQSAFPTFFSSEGDKKKKKEWRTKKNNSNICCLAREWPAHLPFALLSHSTVVQDSGFKSRLHK